MRRLMPFVLAVGAALLVLAGLGLSLYLWSGTDRSLATTLDLAGRMLGEGRGIGLYRPGT